MRGTVCRVFQMWTRTCLLSIFSHSEHLIRPTLIFLLHKLSPSNSFFLTRACLYYTRLYLIFMEQSFLRRCSSQEILDLSWNLRVHYRIHNSLSLDHILGQINPDHTFTPFYFKTILTRYDISYLYRIFKLPILAFQFYSQIKIILQ
jgi:hypothetical protein